MATKEIYTAFARNSAFGIEGVTHHSSIRAAKRAARETAENAGYGWIAEVEEEGMLSLKFIGGRWTV